MDTKKLLENVPFARLLGVEVAEVTDGYTEGRVEMHEGPSWNANRVMAHGDMTFTLAGTVGGVAFVSEVDQPVPAIDVRIDYLSAGTGGLRAEADVVQLGGDVGTVDVDVYATDGNHMTTARGVYRAG